MIEIKMPISLIVNLILFALFSGFYCVMAFVFIKSLGNRVEQGVFFYILNAFELLFHIILPLIAIIGIVKRRFWAKIISALILIYLIIGQIIAAYEAIFIAKERVLTILQIVSMIILPLATLLIFTLWGKRETSYFNGKK